MLTLKRSQHFEEIMEIRSTFELHGRTWYFNILHPELLGMPQPDCNCGGEACCAQYTQAFEGTVRGLETENVTIWPDASESEKRELGLEGWDMTMIVRRMGNCYDRGVSDAKKLIESPEYAIVLPWVTDGPPLEYDDENSL
jgi:hypothetical protein